MKQAVIIIKQERKKGIRTLSIDQSGDLLTKEMSVELMKLAFKNLKVPFDIQAVGENK